MNRLVEEKGWIHYIECICCIATCHLLVDIYIYIGLAFQLKISVMIIALLYYRLLH
jgi:hypothetical protein